MIDQANKKALLERARNNPRSEAKAINKKHDDAVLKDKQRVEFLLKCLMSGKAMSDKDGRELLWSLLMGGDELKPIIVGDPVEMSQRLCAQVYPQRIYNLAKSVELKLFHKMEIEASDRMKQKKEDA